MSISDIINMIELIFTGLGLILIVFGWIIPYKQKILMEKHRAEENQKLQKIAWEKDLIDQQISKLYGPISALLREQEILMARIIYMFGRDCIFDNNHPELKYFSEEEKRIWIHFVDTYKLPLNKRIIEIVRANRHLIYNSEIPTCFNVFLDYTLGWELLDNQKKKDVPNHYDYHYEFSFPKEFSYYINNTLTLLTTRQKELVGIMNNVGSAF